MFLFTLQPVQSIADRYARKVRSKVQRASQETEEPSLGEQAGMIQVWISVHACLYLGTPSSLNSSRDCGLVEGVKIFLFVFNRPQLLYIE